MSSACIDAICKKYEGSVRIAGLDIVLVPNLLNAFGAKPSILDDLVANYPFRGAGDEIVPETVQWVRGDNAALKYRGNPLKREKIWLQRGTVRAGYAYYYYTGVQWEVVPAQTDWAQCTEISGIVDHYDNFCDEMGALKTNQGIITRYPDGKYFIGAHFDKPKSIAPSNADKASLITVMKIGEVGRRFNLYNLESTIIWSAVIQPGDALIMTLEANLQTKHEVPICAEGEVVGDSGSIVFRSISDIVPYDDVQKKLEASRKGKARAKERKDANKAQNGNSPFEPLHQSSKREREEEADAI